MGRAPLPETAWKSLTPDQRVQRIQDMRRQLAALGEVPILEPSALARESIYDEQEQE